MLSVTGNFDGKNLKLNSKVKITKPRKVLVTFLVDEDDANEDILILADKGGSFDFLNDPEEDVYSDDNLDTITSSVSSMRR